jgi:hypothetical protein
MKRYLLRAVGSFVLPPLAGGIAVGILAVVLAEWLARQ